MKAKADRLIRSGAMHAEAGPSPVAKSEIGVILNVLAPERAKR
jgi:hypothetical protein